LVRQEAFELLRELERQRAEQAKARAPASPPTSAELIRARESATNRQGFAAEPKPKPLPRRLVNSFGLSVTAELVHLERVDNVCTPLTSNADVKCYVRSSPYSAQSDGSAGIAAGLLFGARRVSLVYARELSPSIAVSGRAGFAFAGDGVVPWSAELRLRAFPGSGFWGGDLRPFLYSGAGVMWSQASVSVTIPEYDEPAEAGSQPSRYTRARAVRTYGWALVAGGAGLRLGLSRHWWLEAELGIAVSFPQVAAVFWRPGLGLAYDF
jgi:hypothetical protein